MADLAMVEKTLATFVVPGQVVELRCLHVHGRDAICGVFNDMRALARQAVWMDEAGATACYIIPNPLRPERLGADTGSNKADVLQRHWLLIDVDPYHPSGTNTTEAEKRAAAVIWSAVQELLERVGLRNPVTGDSGNGLHLAYPVLLPHDDASQDLLRDLLRALDARLGDRLTDLEKIQLKARQPLAVPKAKVDASCHDAPRNWKLYGTMVRKGPHSEERPWRQAMLLGGEPWNEATARHNAALLPAAIEVARAKEEPAHPRASLADLDRFGSTLQVQGQVTALLAYCRAGLKNECDRVAGAVVGERNDQLNRSAFAVGQLIGTDRLNYEEALNSLYLAALGAGCDSPKKDLDTLSRAMRDGMKQPRQIPDRELQPQQPSTPSQPGAPVSPPPVHRPEIYSAADLLAMELPEPRWAIPGILPEGLSILGGKPKLGKSWLALNMSVAVSSGLPYLGVGNVSLGGVLYIALEDSKRRLRDRLRQLLAAQQLHPPGGLIFARCWPRQDEGGLGYLDNFLKANPLIRLVVIDTWPLFRPRRRAKGGAESYEEDYNSAAELKAVADAHQLAMLAIAHCRKAAADDWQDELMGSQGFAGAADTTFVLRRDRGEKTARLHMTGRDVDESTLPLLWNPDSFLWSLGKALAPDEPGQARPALPPALATAVAWLADFLKDGQSHRVVSVRSAADAAGISSTALYGARDHLAVIQEGSRGHLTWQLIAQKVCTDPLEEEEGSVQTEVPYPETPWDE